MTGTQPVSYEDFPVSCFLKSSLYLLIEKRSILTRDGPASTELFGLRISHCPVGVEGRSYDGIKNPCFLELCHVGSVGQNGFILDCPLKSAAVAILWGRRGQSLVEK
jgi:hypothetical protein